MAAFRILLILLLIAIVAYTGLVIAQHGWNLFPDFFGAIARLGWPGQFNVDFTSFLILSALWTAWRNRFSASGMALALLAFFFGGLFLTIYLLILLARYPRDLQAVLMGPSRC